MFKKQFGGQGIVDIKVGYANGNELELDINYKKVCLGSTNFVESIQISYEPEQVPLKDLLDIFFRMHDATTFNSQGPDVGTQYRSAILYHRSEDKLVVGQARDEAQKKWYPKHQISTIIEPINVWYDAEDYHQEYLDKNPGGYACPSHFIRTTPKA